MNNILKQAKELEKGCGKTFYSQGGLGMYCGKTRIGKDIQYCPECQEEATKLLKIAREGCGKKFETVYIFGNKVKVKCPFKENGFKDLVCPDCQEAIKILEEVHKR